MKINLGYNQNLWETRGIKKPYIWDTNGVPHIMIAGTTGGGKTVLAQLIINALLTASKPISICDFKAGGDWNDIVPDYAEFWDCDRLLDSFYDDFMDAISHKRKDEKYLIFDEFSSFAMSKDNKDYKELMQKISHLAFMGRSFGYKLVFISQQFNSKVMDTAIREQFGIKIYMGSRISTESATMLFPNCEINKSQCLPKYCGYISMPQKDIDIIQIPFISDTDALKRLLIKKGQSKYT